MTSLRRGAIALAVGVAAVAVGGRARAQGIDLPPIFRVEISTTQPGTRVHLEGSDGVTTCGER
ncbi:MAG TPA: hypothetical protein VN903_34790, partial [Polyangia bacterium]|nr:hypothetical protein [Polyangia bacterium]